MWSICNWKYIYAIIIGSRNKFDCVPDLLIKCVEHDMLTFSNLLPSELIPKCCCIIYALLLCSRCNIKLSPPISANAAKISTQEFLTKRLRKNMKLLIMLCITAYYSNILLSDPSPIIGYACHSLTHWLTNSRLVNLIDVTLACEDAYSNFLRLLLALM